MHRTRTGFGRLIEFGADVIVECAGKPESFKIAFESLRKDGAVLLTGMLGGLIDESTE
jgi:threonine dehydrogenase-like Zn-dependent dehydrogenase